jgi:outer membrane cobalamin receptor
MVSGALSYENLNLVNGVVINENLRGQARNLFIEDAIQETKVSTGSISAEYGRFQGGVINSITKSGSNVFSGSFRISFTNDSWSSLTPYPGDQNIDDTVPVYEATSAGRSSRTSCGSSRGPLREGQREHHDEPHGVQLRARGRREAA